MNSLAVSGEPSAPKLEGQMGEDGNSIKVKVIKQDDGGSPIRHYLVKYRAVSSLLPGFLATHNPNTHPAGPTVSLEQGGRAAHVPGRWLMGPG